MSEGSAQGGRSTVGPLFLAVIFLAVLGAGAGFSLGTLAKDAHTGPTTPPTATTEGNAGGGPQINPDTTTTTPGGGNTGGGGNTNTGGNTNSTQCPRHTVDLANAGQLSLALYLRTAKSEVWICQAADGALFYQGHAGRPGEELHERVNALYLETIETEGSNGYVATNSDPSSGHVTRYHVTRNQLIIEHVWNPQTNETQPAV